MKKLNQVILAINNTTDNEDHRQDLWVAYLSDPSRIDSLDEIHKNNLIDQEHREKIQQIFTSSFSEETLNAINELSPLERSIVCLIMIGLSSAEISKRKNISEVRIKQAIRSIRYNKVWSKKPKDDNNGTKEETN